MAPPWKQGNVMTNEIREWDTDGFDKVVRFLIGPVAVTWILLFAIAVTAASATPKSHRIHFTLKQVEAGCTKGNGTLTAVAGSGGYGCIGNGGTVSCTAKGNCTFTPKTSGVKIARNASIENLIRS
jgi:hypothetical protein